MEFGPLGHLGVTAAPSVGQELKPERGSVITRHLVEEEVIV